MVRAQNERQEREGKESRDTKGGEKDRSFERKNVPA